MEAPPGIEPGIRVLQTRALPLGHGAVSCMKKRLSAAGIVVERETGLEPATSALARLRSTK